MQNGQGINKALARKICEVTGAEEVASCTLVQSLWSGYGAIERYALMPHGSVIVKHVKLQESLAKQGAHPRGWNTRLSHARKVHSYQVEQTWYDNYAHRCDTHCRVARPYSVVSGAQPNHSRCRGILDDEQALDVLIILEDLNEAGFPIRYDELTYQQMKPCITWLANFHALHMAVKPKGLWACGTYWHLDTRPDELAALADIPLKNAAKAIDQTLKDSRYQTIVHGDAKLANFCFSEDGQRVAVVDFQYVGRGCGMKDLAYFIGSCLHDDDCERYEHAILNDYFSALSQALQRLGSQIDIRELECEWRGLFPYAWADFHRFIKGWSPGHWKINTYSERITKEVIDALGS